MIKIISPSIHLPIWQLDEEARMQFGNTLASAPTVQQRKDRWEQLLASRPDAPEVLDFAEQWANKMERLKEQTGQHIWKLVDLSLQKLRTPRSRLTEEQFGFALEALLLCWSYQTGLRRWAGSKGLLSRD